MDTAIPLLVFVLMFIIGASLTTADFSRLRDQSKTLLIATFGQLLLLPLVAAIIIYLFSPPAAIAAGMLLVAICPGGAISNFYTFLAKANTAFSVTLTTLTSIASTLTLPLLLVLGAPLMFEPESGIKNLVTRQTLQLVLLLVLPISLGMLVRYLFPQQTQNVMPTLELLAGIGLIAILMAIFYQFQDQIISEFESLALYAFGFTLIAMSIAWFIGKWLLDDTGAMVAMMIEYPVRNLALTALIATRIFQNSEYLLFAAVFFVVQTPVMIAIIVMHRKRVAEDETSVDGGLVATSEGD